jgi:hypothetical protein
VIPENTEEGRTGLYVKNVFMATRPKLFQAFSLIHSDGDIDDSHSIWPKVPFFLASYVNRIEL